MIRFLTIPLLLALVLLIALTGCQTSDSESGETDNRSEASERNDESESGEDDEGSESGEDGEGSGSGEHDGEGSESGDEESAQQYTKGEIYDQVRRGARLVISYNSGANAFIGTVENTTENTLTKVRVEVHLSNGVELGPTTPIDLAPGESADIRLAASSQPFETWSAHPEVG